MQNKPATIEGDRVFEARPDWYEAGIRPRIVRRTAIAFLVLVVSAAWWWVAGSWIPVVVALAVVLERTFEFANISTTKKLIASMRVTVSADGLMLSGGGMESVTFYPWRTLRAHTERTDDGRVSTITIEDATRERSTITLKGYEAMDELSDVIEQHSGVQAPRAKGKPGGRG